MANLRRPTWDVRIWILGMWTVPYPKINIRLASNKVAMARYGLILSQNEAYHFQKAFPIAPGPPNQHKNHQTPSTIIYINSR